MLPRGGVDDAINDRTMSPLLRDCCFEVLNVMTAVFTVPNGPHVRLYEMYGPGGNVPADVAALAARASRRMDVQLRIAGYGSGPLSIIVR